MTDWEPREPLPQLPGTERRLTAGFICIMIIGVVAPIGLAVTRSWLWIALGFALAGAVIVAMAVLDARERGWTFGREVRESIRAAWYRRD